MSSLLRVGSQIPAKPTNFIKLERDKILEFVPAVGLDEMVSFDQHTLWRDEGHSPFFPCIAATGEVCPGCERKIGKKFIAFIKVFVMENDQLVEKFLPFKVAVLKSLREISDMVGTIKNRKLRIKKTGQGMKTKYTVINVGDIVKLPESTLDYTEVLGSATNREAIINLLDRKPDETTEAPF